MRMKSILQAHPLCEPHHALLRDMGTSPPHAGGEEVGGVAACRAGLEAGHTHSGHLDARGITTHSGKAVHTGPRRVSTPRTGALRPLSL